METDSGFSFSECTEQEWPVVTPVSVALRRLGEVFGESVEPGIILEGIGADASAAGAASPLPCQDSNNSIELLKQAWNELATNHRKTAHALKRNVEQLIRRYGIERIAFLTITFAEHITDPKEAQRRWNSFATNVLIERYGARYIRVFERQVSGRIHYHVLLVLDDDIRTGVNFDEFDDGNYRSAGPALRREWAFLMSNPKKGTVGALERYGFGRSELVPIKSCADAIAQYVGKYIAKHIEMREERDKGVRLVSYGKGLLGVSNAKFGWVSTGAANWRRKLGYLAGLMGCTNENYQDVFRLELGPKWAWFLGPAIMNLKFNDYPTAAQACADWDDLVLPLGATNIKLERHEEVKRTQLILQHHLMERLRPNYRRHCTKEIYENEL